MGLMKSLAATIIGQKVGEKSSGSGLLGAGIGFLVTRIATRSIPGAALVGGGYLAKKYYDKRKADKAADAAQATGLSDEDTDMAMARATGETEIAGLGTQVGGAVDVHHEPDQLDAIPVRPVTG